MPIWMIVSIIILVVIIFSKDGKSTLFRIHIWSHICGNFIFSSTL